MRGYAFGVFELDLDRRELRRQGIRLHLQDKPFDLLVALVENAGRELSREEIHQRLWPDGTFVDFEAGINTAVHKLRQALGDVAQTARYIETHARHGYCFVAAVKSLGAEPAPPSPASEDGGGEAALLDRAPTPPPAAIAPEAGGRRRTLRRNQHCHAQAAAGARRRRAERPLHRDPCPPRLLFRRGRANPRCRAGSAT